MPDPTEQCGEPDDILADWKAKTDAATLPEFPGYEVHSDGTIWSTRNWRGYGNRQVVPVMTPHGYLKVRFSLLDGRRVNRRVHVLVARAFLGPQPSGTEVRHLNGDKTDNRADNLAWGTGKENAADRDLHGTTARGSRNGEARLTEEDVVAIRAANAAGTSQYALADQYGVGQQTISKIVTRKRWRHVA